MWSYRFVQREAIKARKNAHCKVFGLTGLTSLGRLSSPGSSSVHAVQDTYANQAQLQRVPDTGSNPLAKHQPDLYFFDNAMIHKVYLLYAADLVESARDRAVTKRPIVWVLSR